MRKEQTLQTLQTALQKETTLKRKHKFKFKSSQSQTPCQAHVGSFVIALAGHRPSCRTSQTTVPPRLAHSRSSRHGYVTSLIANVCPGTRHGRDRHPSKVSSDSSTAPQEGQLEKACQSFAFLLVELQKLRVSHCCHYPVPCFRILSQLHTAQNTTMQLLTTVVVLVAAVEAASVRQRRATSAALTSDLDFISSHWGQISPYRDNAETYFGVQDGKPSAFLPRCA